MTSIQALRERRAAKAQEARKLLDENTGEKWTGDVKGRVDALYNEIDAIDDQVSAHERLIALDADKPNGALADIQSARDAFDPKDPKNAHRVLLNKWIRQGDDALNASEWASIRNTMSTTTGSEGGFTVPSLISAKIYDIMKAFGVMRVVSEIIPTADGKPLSFPTTDGTAEVGEWIAQNTTATAADPVFGTVSLNVFKASSKIIAVPIELLQDTILDMEGFIQKRIAQRIGRLGNLAFTTGTGTTQPDGYIPKTSAGKTGIAAQGTGVIYDDLIDLIHSIDPAYRGPQASFQAHDTIVKTIRKIKDTAGRPIWMPSYDGGINMGLNRDGNGGYMTSGDPGGPGQVTAAVPFDTLLGYRLYVNNDLATPALNSKSLAFGDFSYYKIRDAMDVNMFRFTDSAYTKLGQVGFLAWARMGGNLMDANAIKYFQCAAS